MISQDLGNGPMIYDSFQRWRCEGVWERLMATLRRWEGQE